MDENVLQLGRPSPFPASPAEARLDRVFWQAGKPPEGLWLPDQGVPPNRGRG